MPSLASRSKGGAAWRLRRASHVATHWPMLWWRLAGHGDFELAGERIRFNEVGRYPYDWWALRARAGTWEPETLRRFAEVVAPGDIVFDVGAQFGPYTLLASRGVGAQGRVVAFEPDPVARRLLGRNLTTEGAVNVVVQKSALSDRTGRAWLQAQKLGEGCTTLVHRPAGPAIDTLRLADFCARTELMPDVLKIDVEGAEDEVLAGAGASVLERVRALLVEVHESALTQRGVDIKEFLERTAAPFESVEVLDSREPGNYTVLYLAAAGMAAVGA